MRSYPVPVVLALAGALIISGCRAEPAADETMPPVPVQGGEALQVEVNPEATLEDTMGAPGATAVPPR